MQFKTDLQSAHKVLFLQARELLLSFEGISETKKLRITTYANDKGGICHMRTRPYDIDLGFLKGAKMAEKMGLLNGNDKAIRVLSLTSMNQEAVIYYVQQALNSIQLTNKSNNTLGKEP